MIYFDNAATTLIDPRVKEEMLPYLDLEYGNPSSLHSVGKKTKNIIEKSRKTVANLLNTVPGEVFFTSGGTESNNTILTGIVLGIGVKHIITSSIEHHSVLHTIKYLQKQFSIKVHYVCIDEFGALDLNHLISLVQKYPKSLVTVMHANNEIGNVSDIEWIANKSKEYECYIHTDAIQTIGHFPFDFTAINIDSASASAHKFHGPKGIGLLLKKQAFEIPPLLHGGGQERLFRGGTENVMGIVGCAKALELSVEELMDNNQYVITLKKRFIEGLKNKINGVQFNGFSSELDSKKALYTVLNVNIPYQGDPDMLLFKLDIAGISCSGGSACSSGSSLGSHVIREIKDENEGYAPIRFSFSHFNTSDEIDMVINKLSTLLRK